MAGSSPQRALLPWMDKVVDRLAAVAMSEPGKAFAGARLGVRPARCARVDANTTSTCGAVRLTQRARTTPCANSPLPGLPGLRLNNIPPQRVSYPVMSTWTTLYMRCAVGLAITKAINATVIPLDQAPQGYAGFDREPQENSSLIRTGCSTRGHERVAWAHPPSK
jgi:hypothetical protein